MRKLVDLIRNEPVASTTTVVAIVQATVTLGLAFGWWTWSSEQTGAVLGVVTAGLALAFSIVRGAVTPEQRAAQRVEAARNETLREVEEFGAAVARGPYASPSPTP
jgi:hypothetical protein